MLIRHKIIWPNPFFFFGFNIFDLLHANMAPLESNFGTCIISWFKLKDSSIFKEADLPDCEVQLCLLKTDDIYMYHAHNKPLKCPPISSKLILALGTFPFSHVHAYGNGEKQGVLQLPGEDGSN